jgi:Entner-Doudoroff aldolase
MTHQASGTGPELLAAGETMAMIIPAAGGRLTDATLFIAAAGGVSYYRKESAAAGLSAADAGTVPLNGVRVLHVSGITAAISGTAAAFLDRLLDRARHAGVTVSFDVNHRPQLWPAAAAGAGTIIAAEQVPLARRAGASYLVSPGLDAGLVREAGHRGMPILPGVATPSEVQAAASLGLSWLKAFPAHWLGREWFGHIRGPFPGLRFVATGGMNARNAAQFLDAGARVVAVGSALEDLTQLSQLAELLKQRKEATGGTWPT